jgi:hypothetical protein
VGADLLELPVGEGARIGKEPPDEGALAMIDVADEGDPHHM